MRLKASPTNEINEYYLSVKRTIPDNSSTDGPAHTYSLLRVLEDRFITEPEVSVDKEIDSEEDIIYYEMCPFNKYAIAE